LLLCFNGCKEVRDGRCDGSDLSLNFITPLLAESISHALLMQVLAATLQALDVLSDRFIHGNRVAYNPSPECFVSNRVPAKTKAN
jgi:hypothetical protein